MCHRDDKNRLTGKLPLGRAKRIWYLSLMRAAKVQASLRIRAVSPEPSLLAHINSESSETFRQKARSLAPLNGWACAVKICHDGMLEDTNSLDGAPLKVWKLRKIAITALKFEQCCLTTELCIQNILTEFEMGQVMRKRVLRHMQTTKVQISLHICTV